MTNDESARILALVKGEEVWEVCPACPLKVGTCPECHGTSRIRTEPENGVERAVAALRAELEAYKVRATRDLLNSQGLRERTEQALEAERAASEEWRQKCVNERVRYDNEKEAHEETKRQLAVAQEEADRFLEDRVLHAAQIGGLERQLAEAHEGMLRDRQARVVADNNLNQALREKAEAEATVAAMERGMPVVEDWAGKWADVGLDATKRAQAAEQRATEAEALARHLSELEAGAECMHNRAAVAAAEAARDAALRDNAELADTAANARFYIETLREALAGLVRWVDHETLDRDIAAGAHPVRTAKQALATTPTSSGLIEKVRALCVAVRRMIHAEDRATRLVAAEATREALTALYAIAPGLKPRG